MNKNDIDYTNFIKILEEELLPAMGCTEPIAVAYCAAMARKTLGAAPDRVVVEASGNIIIKPESPWSLQESLYGNSRSLSL